MGTPTIQQILMNVYKLMWYIPVILIGFAVVFFFYRLLTHITSSNEKSKRDTRQVIFFGLIAIFVMVSMWGIVHVVQRTLFPTNIVKPGV